MTNMQESDLFKQLMKDPDSSQDFLLANNIITRVGPLGKSIAGMVYRSKSGYYYIIANQLLSFDEAQFVFFHELAHIVTEAPQSPYLLRMEHNHENEVVADRMAVYALEDVASLS
jgi:Zn-dependent peptidase ImmA (M78 family)